eukprot:COSAG01_NODE_40031_length_468_cov_2.598916_2_plen_64_part_01
MTIARVSTVNQVPGELEPQRSCWLPIAAGYTRAAPYTTLCTTGSTEVVEFAVVESLAWPVVLLT